jgi:hypothetical protein
LIANYHEIVLISIIVVIGEQQLAHTLFKIIFFLCFSMASLFGKTLAAVGIAEHSPGHLENLAHILSRETHYTASSESRKAMGRQHFSVQRVKRLFFDLADFTF